MQDFATSQTFVIATVEERLRAWRELEKAATQAEKELVRIGRAVSDPQVRDLVLSAKDLRDRSNREFAAILRVIKHQ